MTRYREFRAIRRAEPRYRREMNIHIETETEARYTTMPRFAIDSAYPEVYSAVVCDKGMVREIASFI